MKTFVTFTSAEEGIIDPRVDLDLIDCYFGYNSEKIQDTFGTSTNESLKECRVIKTVNGAAFYVKETLEEIDEIFRKDDNLLLTMFNND